MCTNPLSALSGEFHSGQSMQITQQYTNTHNLVYPASKARWEVVNIAIKETVLIAFLK